MASRQDIGTWSYILRGGIQHLGLDLGVLCLQVLLRGGAYDWKVKVIYQCDVHSERANAEKR